MSLMLSIMSQLQLKLCHSPFELHKLHIERGLLSFQIRDLLRDSCVLLFLVLVVSLHFILDLFQLPCQGLPHISSLRIQNCFEGLLFRSQQLHFLLVECELIPKYLYHIL